MNAKFKEKEIELFYLYTVGKQIFSYNIKENYQMLNE